MVKRKGISPLISYSLLIAIILISIITVLQVSGPILEGSRNAASIENAQNILLDVNSKILDSASFGRMTVTTTSFSVRDGEYIVSPENDTVDYIIETEAEIISRGASRMIGPINMSSVMNGSAVRLRLNYSSTEIDIVGERISMGSGFFELNFRNQGVSEDGRTAVEVSR